MDEEIWKPIPGYEGYYSASNLGRIRSENRNVRHYAGGVRRFKSRIRKAHIGTWGYMIVCLSKENIDIKFSVHRLVLMSFTGGDRKGLDVRHLDGDRTNNRLENLAWGTRTDNMQDCIVHGRTNKGSKNPNSKLTEKDVLAIRADTRRQRIIADDYNIDASTVSDIKN